MMIVEETYQLPADKYLPALLKDPDVQIKISKIASDIANLKTYSDLDALYDPYLTNKALAHIVNYHTNKMIKSGILTPKNDDEYDTVFFHAANNGEIIFEKRENISISAIRRKLKRLLHVVFKQHTKEILNFHYSDNKRLYNSHTSPPRFEYVIDHKFKKIIGSVRPEGSEDFEDTHTLRVILAKISKYDDPFAVSMFPILDKKE